MKNILIPFNFSGASINALEYAIKFAEPNPASKFFLLYINTEKLSETDIQKRFQEIREKYEGPKKLFIEGRSAEGDLVPAIMEIQKDLEIDLVLMGTRGASLKREEFTTRTAKFVREANIPVLIIPEKCKRFRLKTIILPIGSEKIAERSRLNHLLEVSRRFDARVHVLTVQKSPINAHSEDDESNESTLQYFLEMFYSHHSFLESEDIEQGILEYIEKNDVDMLAIMPKTHLEGERASEGKLTHILALHTNVPFLVLN